MKFRCESYWKHRILKASSRESIQDSEFFTDFWGLSIYATHTLHNPQPTTRSDAQLLRSKIMMRKEERRDDKGVIVDVNGMMARLLYGGLDGGVILVAMQGREPIKILRDGRGRDLRWPPFYQ